MGVEATEVEVATEEEEATEEGEATAATEEEASAAEDTADTEVAGINQMRKTDATLTRNTYLSFPLFLNEKINIVLVLCPFLLILAMTPSNITFILLQGKDYDTEGLRFLSL